MGRKELFNKELLEKIVDKAGDLEGTDLHGIACKLSVNYVRLFLSKDSEFMFNQKKEFNYKNLMQDPVYEKLKGIYFENKENMGRRMNSDGNKIANYVLDNIKNLSDRKGISESEYLHMLNSSNKDLVNEVKNSKIYNFCFFENQELIGEDFGSSVWSR